MSPYRLRSSTAMAEQILRLTIMKLLNQFEQVDSATPFARRLEGNTSLGMAHG